MHTVRTWSSSTHPPQIGSHLKATAALDPLARGITSNDRNPAAVHHARKSAPEKSNASPNSMSMFSDIISPKVFLPTVA